MQEDSHLKRLEREAGKLTSQGQLRLVEMLVHQLRTKECDEDTSVDWAQLYGLGKVVWGGEDAQEYVDKLREDR